MGSKFYLPKGFNTTPFNRRTNKNGVEVGLRHYDELIGVENEHNIAWRFVALCSMFAFFLSIGVNFYAISRPATVPLVVTVSETGEAKYVGDISHLSYGNIKVPEIAIRRQLEDFITYTGTLSTDGQVIKANIAHCYAMLSETAAAKYSLLLRENNPFALFGKAKKSILLESTLKLSNQSYQIDYIQNTTTLAGQISARIRYRAVISMACMEPPKGKEKQNPLGIYITDFDITEVNVLQSSKE